MSTIVTGCGRSGTNIALEILTGNPVFKPSETPEDKIVFKRNRRYQPEYLTKCDTCYYNETDVKVSKQWDPFMRFIWCIRDPRDMVLSKLYRGRPQSEGGDCVSLADDATYEGLMADLTKMSRLYRYIRLNYPDDIFVVRMEESILDTKKVVFDLCEWLDIGYGVYEEKMMDFPSRMRNKHKARRYGNYIDKNQTYLYLSWETEYDGWFKDRTFSGRTIPEIFKNIEHFCEEFGYGF